jgi:hypothetical protein
MVDQANHKNTNANALPDVECVFAGYYVVAFIDLLGTEAKNSEIKAQPEFPAEMLKREVDKVKKFQRNFYDFFEDAARSEKRFRSQRPENLKADLEKLQGNDVKNYAFSDSLIFYASLNTKQGRLVPVSSCFNILSALVCAQLWSLARGVPFRGGVEIGRAATFNGNQILGPALSDAVKLEKQAQFPRILMGDEFHKYLQLNSQLPLDTLVNRANREFADICIGHICESDEPCQLCESDKTEDNRTRVFSLDVHSDFVAELIGKPHQELLNKARNFAESEIQRFSGHNKKLACRYRHLLNYLGGER